MLPLAALWFATRYAHLSHIDVVSPVVGHTPNVHTTNLIAVIANVDFIVITWRTQTNEGQCVIFDGKLMSQNMACSVAARKNLIIMYKSRQRWFQSINLTNAKQKRLRRLPHSNPVCE